MTQEEKQLLLKDLCGRLPYELIVLEKAHKHGPLVDKDYRLDCFVSDEVSLTEFIMQYAEYIKPYLRPMSSMTKEEKKEVSKFGVCDDGAFHNDIYDVGTSMEEAFTAISWLLQRHFDINYLIEKGLALEAPEGMYKTE